MRIGEIAEKTGLNISNIRFYEKKGLIGPDREEESKYRNYTDEDLKRLKQIILYRKMDLPVETIGKIFQGQLTSEDALQQQLIDLEKKQQNVQSSLELCQKMVMDGAYEDFDVDYYLGYVKTEEASGRSYQIIDDFVEDFSSRTGFDQYVGGRNRGWWLFSEAWLNRLVKIIWILMIVLMPVVCVVDDIMEDSTDWYLMLFCIFWFLAILPLFFDFRKDKNPEQK